MRALTPSAGPSLREQVYSQLCWLRPPYTSAELTPVDPREPDRDPGFGAVLLLQVRCPLREGALAAAAAPMLRRSFPDHPLVVWTPHASPDVVLLASQTARHHVRAVVTAADDYAPALRRTLPRPAHLAADVLEWLCLRGLTFRPRLSYVIHQILQRSPEHETVRELFRAIHEPAASIRAGLAARMLPSPGEWFRLSRALHAALELQRSPHRPLLEVAYELGYSDHSALSQQLHRTFRLRPTAVRSIVGWEGLLGRWVTRARSVSARVGL